MSIDQLKDLFPNASTGFLRINTTDITPDRAAPTALVECDLRAGPLATSKTKGANPDRFLVRVTSYRRRLLDEDNLCGKFMVDCCRYAGLIPGDAPGTTRIKTRQEKVRSKEDERTEIEIGRIQ